MHDLQAAGGTAIDEHAPARVLPARVARAWVLALGLVGFGLDLITKTLAITHLDPYDPPRLLGGLLTLQLVRNPGAAFSMGESLTVLLTVIAATALVGLLGWVLPRVRHVGWVVASGFLLAGILGNLTDRLFRSPGFARGHVVDFLQLPYFAVFNVADMFITFAAVIIVWLTVITKVGFDGRPADG